MPYRPRKMESPAVGRVRAARAELYGAATPYAAKVALAADLARDILRVDVNVDDEDGEEAGEPRRTSAAMADSTGADPSNAAVRR